MFLVMEAIRAAALKSTRVLQRAFHTVIDGWRQLADRAGDALTQFIPRRGGGDVEQGKSLASFPELGATPRRGQGNRKGNRGDARASGRRQGRLRGAECRGRRGQGNVQKRCPEDRVAKDRRAPQRTDPREVTLTLQRASEHFPPAEIYGGKSGNKVSGMTTRRWQDWLNLALGAWLFLSPWLMQYGDFTGAAWNAHLLGLAIMVFAAWALYKPSPWQEVVSMAFGWLFRRGPLASTGKGRSSSTP